MIVIPPVKSENHLFVCVCVCVCVCSSVSTRNVLGVPQASVIVVIVVQLLSHVQLFVTP